jgi:hypothetical protein
VFSLGVWFQTPTASGTKIIGYESWQYDTNIANYDRQLFVGFDGKLHFGLYPLDYNPSGFTSATVSDNVWHYAVATYNTNTGIANIYLDGALANTVTNVTQEQLYAGWWKIGGMWTNGWPAANPGIGYFVGNIGPVHIYNRDITAAEVLNNYQNDSTRFGRTKTIIGAKSMANNISNTITYSANTLNEVDFNPNSGFQKNLYMYSNFAAIDNYLYFNNRNTVVSKTALAPDGSYTALQLAFNLIYAVTQQGSTTPSAPLPLIPGQYYTASVYAKLNGGARYVAIVTSNGFANYDLINGSLAGVGAPATNYTITPAPNGFYRCTLTWPAINNDNVGIWLGGYNGSDFTGNTMTIWGPQVELGNVATTYVTTDLNRTVISNSAFKSDNTSTTYTKGFIDEVTGVPPLNGNIISVDPSKIESYPGSGLTLYNLANTNNSGTFTSVTSDYPKYRDIIGYGSSIAFDGVDGSINFPNVNLQQDFTLEFWVKQEKFYSFSFAGHGIGSPNQGLHIWWNNYNSIRFGMYANDTDFYPTISSGWNHFVFTYQNSSPWTKQGFQNGVYLNPSVAYASAQYLGTGTPFRLGTIYGSGTTYNVDGLGIGTNAIAKGEFGQFNFYNRVLSNAEILNNYNFQRTKYGV